MAPLIAVFILFDLVVYNPEHVETKRNQAYLEISAGYFTRLELATDGGWRGCHIAELTSIARDCLNRETSVHVVSIPRRTVASEAQQNQAMYTMGLPENTICVSESGNTVSRPADVALVSLTSLDEIRPLHPLIHHQLSTEMPINTENLFHDSMLDTLHYPTFETWMDFGNTANEINILDLFTQGFN